MARVMQLIGAFAVCLVLGKLIFTFVTFSFDAIFVLSLSPVSSIYCSFLCLTRRLNIHTQIHTRTHTPLANMVECLKFYMTVKCNKQ